MKTRKQIYIAGPMTGKPSYNFLAFDTARDRLMAEGWAVVSPADMDRMFGFDPIANPELVVTKEFLEEARKRDMEALERVDAIYMLDGWEDSTGAKAEYWTARWRNIEVIHQESAGILQTAIQITSGDRRRDYDSATPNHERIAGAWNWYIRSRKHSNDGISALDVSNMMILLKLARACYTPTRDTFVDIAGYARCSAQISGFEKE